MSRNYRGLEKRLAAYGSMSLALAAVSLPQGAKADTIADITTTLTTPVYFDLLTGAFGSTGSSNEFELVTSESGSAQRAYIFGGNGNKFAMNGSSVAKLSPGTPIGPLMNFSSGPAGGTLASNLQAPATPFGQWNGLPASGEVGLEVISGADTYYGWANIVVNPDYTVTLDSFGVEATAPEPASILLLAIGAAGIAAYRRKRAQSEPDVTKITGTNI